jgi:FlaA1/EpsC-like NDP-sugar epimerase
MENFKNKIIKFFRWIFGMQMINRWIIFVIDLFLCALSFSITGYVRFKLVDSFFLLEFLIAASCFLTLCAIFFYLFKSYAGLIRHSNFQEMWRLFCALFLSCVVQYFLMLFTDTLCENYHFFLIANLFFVSLFLMLLVRFLIVYIYNHTVSYANVLIKSTLIYEINAHSIALAQWLSQSNHPQHQIKGFLTREKSARKNRVQDLPVFYMNGDNVDWFMRRNEVNTIIFADYKSIKKESAFVSKCIDMGLSVLVSPPFEGMDASKRIHYKMKPIQFEDLLGRDEISINMERIGTQVKDKVILITGAAGSIGSELVRQLAPFNPKLLVLFDMAETPLHHLRLELANGYPELKYVAIIGDVRSQSRLDYVFKKFNPQVIYHAAAYKHVPLMEENPCEAILVNVQGTMNLSNMALKYGAESLVMISTDKAVNPTNVMGASKRIAEIYVQSLAKECKKDEKSIRFVTTRFGNVLGSNGSVIPYFKEQIESGGPVTVTDPDILRYFMTIPEACRLVLEAASFGNNGEIYVFDMGSPVKIADLARRMIELSGYIPNVDIKIKYIGLRPGEKLYEELLNDEEKTIPTEHKKIMVAKVRQYKFEHVLQSIQTMIKYAEDIEIKETVKAMKKLVPEYKSQNSPFSVLDEYVDSDELEG